ncbi:ABC transporter permease [Phycicoccus endophyticus]|uniref:ABC transporter permease n=1 Tax=Phycicoccus endophyticus TaxID=1690220 RepID=UPI00140C55C8|nr:FtsX-like permease family protein [Phycicoccus endophyticus]NHI20137.1 hypothetical protein [Phycicoccus endophyticus]GGL38089.1 hypothetical protein GCM10012283_20860 [Phycicoccus endophyticus]
MTLLAPSSAGTGGASPTTDEPEERGRFAQWRSSWTLALRMARRDVRRHRGRSALVVVMVLLPTLLLSTVVTLAYTAQVSGAEKIPAAMGTGQALLEGPDPFRTSQLPDPTDGTLGTDRTAKTIAGFDRQASTFANADAVARLVGADVAPLQRYGVRFTVDQRRVTLNGLALDGARGLGDKLRLTSGRWPAPPPADPNAPAEALATPVGLAKGLPEQGTVQVSVDGTERTLSIVGVAEAHDTWATPGVVTAGPVGTTAAYADGGWIVLGEDPVTWEEVEELGAYGFRVTSAEVLRNPPALADLPPELLQDASSGQQQMALVVGLAVVMLLVSTTLLVGPAFAVSATRQRRTLALAASNGAHTPVLRRTVLAQALVLGAASAVTGVALGVLAAWVVTRVTADAEYPPFGGPFDVRYGILAAVALCATGSTFVAALIPARRLGRLDIVGVMRGQSVSPRPSLLVLGAGLLLVAAGAVLTLGGTGVLDVNRHLPQVLRDNAEMPVVVGAVVLIVGSLLLVPVVLAGVGRLGSRLPTALRMAARDLARHRARSAPSVAAVLAVVAGLTFGLTGLESDTEQRRQEYLPTTVPGEVVIRAAQPLDTAALEAAAPSTVVTPNEVFAGDPQMYAMDMPTTPYRAHFVSVVPPGCDVEDTLGWVTDSTRAVECSVAGSQGNTSNTVLALSAEELIRRAELSGSDAEKVREGAAVLLGGTGGSVRVAQGTYRVDPDGDGPADPRVRVTSDTTLPVVHLPLTRENSGRLLGASLAFASGTTATEGWPTRVESWTVREPGASVPDDVVERLQEVLGDEVSVQREDGFQRGDRLAVAILLAVFGLLILVVVLTSTALTVAEQQTDQATLAALGATRGTRRVMAGAQAFVLAAAGCVLGVGVGLVPGIAIARPLTASSWDPLTFTETETGTILAIPWAELATVGVLVPVLAALLAAAGIRRAPRVTRRAT